MPPRSVTLGEPIATGQILPLELRSGEEAALWKDTIGHGYIRAWNALAALRRREGATPGKKRGRGVGTPGTSVVTRDTEEEEQEERDSEEE